MENDLVFKNICSFKVNEEKIQFSESSEVVVDEKLVMRAAIFVGLLFSLCNMLPKHYLIETEDGNEGDGGKGGIIKN